MIKKRNQLTTMIKTPTTDLRGLFGVRSGAALGLLSKGLSFDAHGFDLQGHDSGIGGFKSIIDSGSPEGNLPIA